MSEPSAGKPRPRRIRMLSPRTTRAAHGPHVGYLWLTIGFTFAGLALFGVRVNFFQSDRWNDISVYVVIMVTLVLTVPAVLAARGTNFVYPDIRSKAVRIGLAVVILPTFAAFMSWMAISVAIPDIITRLAGSQFSEKHELSKQFVDSYRHHCDYRVFGSPFPQDYYCAESAEFARLPAKGRMRVHGRQTWLGKHIYFVDPDPQSPR